MTKTWLMTSININGSPNLKIGKRIKKEIFSLSEISFNEDKTYQGRGMGVRKIAMRKNTWV